MRRVCFYSDDSYQARGRKRSDAVIAGVAIEADRSNVRQALIRAEKSSGKGVADWYRTSARARQYYIEAVLEISGLPARVFFRPYELLRSRDYWSARLDTLCGALSAFSPGGVCGDTRIRRHRSSQRMG